MRLRNITDNIQQGVQPKCCMEFPTPIFEENTMTQQQYDILLQNHTNLINSKKQVSYFDNQTQEEVMVDIFAECDEEYTYYDGPIDRVKAQTRFDIINIDITDMSDEEVIGLYNYYELGGDIAPDPSGE